MAEKRREAEAAIDLMSVQYERTQIEENRRNGLIVRRAIYGKLDDDDDVELSAGDCKFPHSNELCVFSK